MSGGFYFLLIMQGYLTISFHKQKTGYGSINFTQGCSSMHASVVKISATNSKAFRHEKSFKQSKCIRR